MCGENAEFAVGRVEEVQNVRWRGIGGGNAEFAVAMVTSDVGNGGRLNGRQRCVEGMQSLRWPVWRECRMSGGEG